MVFIGWKRGCLGQAGNDTRGCAGEPFATVVVALSVSSLLSHRRWWLDSHSGHPDMRVLPVCFAREVELLRTT